MTKKPKSRMDEIELAKSIFDEIVEETESEDWDKKDETKKAASSTPPKKRVKINSVNQTSQ